MAKTNGRTKKKNLEQMLADAIEKATKPKPEKKPTPEKSTYWEFICYPDNPRHLEIAYDIKHGVYPDCTGCYHNKDLTDPKSEYWDDDGTYHEAEPSHPKKPHYHIIVKLPYQGTKGSVERLFPNLESHLIMKVDDPTERYRYLVHQDDPKKYRYKPSDVFGNTDAFYQRYYNNEGAHECDAVCQILDIIENWDYTQGKITYSAVIRICAEKGLYGHLRKGGGLLTSVIKEEIERQTKQNDTERWLDTRYMIHTQVDEIYKLHSALRRANTEIQTMKKLIGE